MKKMLLAVIWASIFTAIVASAMTTEEREELIKKARESEATKPVQNRSQVNSNEFFVLVEKGEEWSLKKFSNKPIKRTDVKIQEVLKVATDKNMGLDMDVVPAYDKIDYANINGQKFIICPVYGSDDSVYTPCNSIFTTFQKTDAFFLPGTLSYFTLSKSLVSTIAGKINARTTIQEYLACKDDKDMPCSAELMEKYIP